MYVVKDCKAVWNNCLRFIRETIGEQTFKTWFEPIVPVRLQNEVLTIQVPNHFFYEWLEEHYVNVLRKAIDLELGPQGRLEYSIIMDKGNEKFKPYTINMPTSGPAASAAAARQAAPPKPSADHRNIDLFGIPLNPKYTFDTFIEGDCNRLARSAGYAIANKPGITSFNPLMIYGGTGLGKTHLVQAIANEVNCRFPEKSVHFVASEKFSNQYIEAIKSHTFQNFYNFYLSVDVLIIDDVQFMAGKEKTQETFFQIFNHLHQSGKQIIMTSDRPPKDLKGMEERLLSRFKWGLSADMQQPDFETRIAIIQKKLEHEGIVISDDVLEYLAYSIDTNIRELEGVLISLIAQSSLTKKEIDLELAKHTLKNIVQEIECEVSIDFIQKFVAEYFNVPVDSLKAKTRKREIVIARQVSMYFSKNYTNMSLKTIGYHFGNRDHSTVIHAISAVNDMMDTDKKFNATMQELTKRLKLKSSV
ncbi:chromosomal replication initiator protein DnaA [Cytophagaceae bacterium ABcell3]|nr:chromosomal replication initiator protein DnaA [Cytophagaceae bacterium ABcell3]